MCGATIPVNSRYLTLPIRWLRPRSDDPERAAERSEGALDQLDFDLEATYAEHREAVWSFASRFLADDASAEDLVHDVFVALPRLWHKRQPGTPVRSFLLGVTVNLARNYSRSAKRRRRLADLWSRETPTATLEHPEQLTSRRDLALRLEHGLNALSHEHRAVFVLVEVEQHSTLEAAEILDVPPGTVRSRLFHAKRQLQVQLWNDQERT